MSKSLSPVQISCLHLAREGTLVRWYGGYWAPSNEPDKYRGGRPEHRGGAVPERYFGIQTIDALERRGLLDRTHAPGHEEWHDARRITAAGLDALTRLEASEPEQ